MEPVRTGIPQGSPISPILAAIFSKGLAERIYAEVAAIRDALPAAHRPTLGRLIMYVDDGKVYVSSLSLETNVLHLQRLYEVARAWAAAEGLLLDDDKRDFTHFTHTMHKLDGTPLRDVPRPTLSLSNNSGGQTVLRPAATYRWLGIYWDPKLSFNAHVKRMAARANGVVDALNMLGNTMSGMSPLLLRAVHLACTLPILCYGAAVWFTDGKQKTLVEQLNVSLRRALRHILGAFKTTPTEALHIETSIPEMDLHLQDRRESAARRFARMPRDHPVIQRLGAAWSNGVVAADPPPLAPSRSVIPSKTSRLQRLALLFPASGERIEARYRAPWWSRDGQDDFHGRLKIIQKRADVDKRRAANEHGKQLRALKQDARHVIAYTDGSLLDGRAGAGFAVYHGDRQVTSRTIGLGRAADVYDGELRGLEMAARAAIPFAANLPVADYTHVHFFADNNAAIGRSFDCAPGPGQLFSIGFSRVVEDFLTQDERHRVSVEWVPGHEDIPWQEAADELAKAGTRRAPSLPVTMTLTRAKRNATEAKLAKWTTRWLTGTRRNSYSPANRIPPSLRPTPHLRSLDKPTLARLIQCRTGHAFTGEYNLAIDKPERGLECPCGEALQTREHILIECPQYSRHRHILRDAVPSLSLTDILGTREGIKATAKFIRSSGAFGRPTALAMNDA